MFDHKEEKDASVGVLLHDVGDFFELARFELVIGVDQSQQKLLELSARDVLSLGGIID